MTLSPRRPLLLAALLGLGITMAPSLAQAIEAGPTLYRLTPAQSRKLFPEWRQLSLTSTQERITILQKHQQCLSSARSLEALEVCQRQQRQAMQTQQRQQRQALRQMLQRNGIPLPPKRQDGDGRRRAEPADGVPMI
jgi:hypothetical protein